MAKKDKVPQRFIEKGEDIVQQLIDGVDYSQFQGKRMTRTDRDVISIKLNRVVRSLYNLKNNSYMILQHRDYNKLVGSRAK